MNWISMGSAAAQAHFESLRRRESKKLVFAHPQFGLPRRFWENVLHHSALPDRINFGTLSNEHTERVVEALTKSCLAIEGKGQFKEEFVTCGGVSLKEIDFRSFESKLIPNLFFAGEILDIDGITGGFNFQAAWTGGWTVAESIKGRCSVAS
jgi:predicted Rossmann fold flavoprotein